MCKTLVSAHKRCGANARNCLWTGKDACAEEDIDRELVFQQQYMHLSADYYLDRPSAFSPVASQQNVHTGGKLSGKISLPDQNQTQRARCNREACEPLNPEVDERDPRLSRPLHDVMGSWPQHVNASPTVKGVSVT